MVLLQQVLGVAAEDERCPGVTLPSVLLMVVAGVAVKEKRSSGVLLLLVAAGVVAERKRVA